MLGWSQTQSEDVQADVEQGSAITDEIANETLDAMEGDFGEDAEDDEAAATVIAQDLLERSAALADTEDGADTAAAVLNSCMKEQFINMGVRVSRYGGSGSGVMTKKND